MSRFSARFTPNAPGNVRGVAGLHTLHYENTGSCTVAAPGFLWIQVFLQLFEPMGAVIAYRAQFAVPVFRHLDKAVVIVVELRFVAVGQNLSDDLPAAGKAALHIAMRNIVTATLYPVFNPCEAFLCGTHSVENRIVSVSQPFVRPIVRGKAGDR